MKVSRFHKKTLYSSKASAFSLWVVSKGIIGDAYKGFVPFSFHSRVVLKDGWKRVEF
jgi:hypothetical protein